MKDRIKLTCECCKKTFDLQKTNEIPKHVFIMHCNFCIECDMNDLMTDYYDEWWDDNENKESEKPIPIGDNQLVMPFIFEGMLKDMKSMDKEQSDVLETAFNKSLISEPTLQNRV